jgi:hypothetical protein
VKAMLDKGLDPIAEAKLRVSFSQRILTSLHDLRRAGKVERIGSGPGVRWKIAPREADLL